MSVMQGIAFVHFREINGSVYVLGARVGSRWWRDLDTKEGKVYLQAGSQS